MKKIAIIAAMGAAFVAAGVQASTGTINFTGTVAAQTCAASVGGTAAPSASTVALPVVQANALSAAAATAGRTAFQISLTGCAASNPAGAGTVKALFENGAGVDSNGRLVNTGSAQNVALQLLDGTTNAVITAGNASQNTGGYVTISAGAATLPYSVQYYATAAAAAGTVASSVTYSLIYQ
jgi:major type 1 subunit fimbrin (pilin)